MIRKKVWQYKCEFCGKKKYSAGHMAKHERRCTMNPNRECGMCKIMGQGPIKLQELIAVLPNAEEYKVREFDPITGADMGISFRGLEDAVEAVWPEVRRRAQECPACLMAAVRQRGIPVPLTPLNFTKESEAIWSEFNQRQIEADAYP